MDDDFADISDEGTTTEPNTELAEDDYKSIQAMADTDHQVHSLMPSLYNNSSLVAGSSGCDLQHSSGAYCQHTTYIPS